ncbi:MAG: hypothetical protein IJ620_02055 [Bacteroidales bacterium]|nr:hypothetical protein [Bacteroidales bacterium]
MSTLTIFDVLLSASDIRHLLLFFSVLGRRQVSRVGLKEQHLLSGLNNQPLRHLLILQVQHHHSAGLHNLLTLR